LQTFIANRNQVARAAPAWASSARCCCPVPAWAASIILVVVIITIRKNMAANAVRRAEQRSLKEIALGICPAYNP
jgi:hypothetical protein